MKKGQQVNLNRNLAFQGTSYKPGTKGTLLQPLGTEEWIVWLPEEETPILCNTKDLE